MTITFSKSAFKKVKMYDVVSLKGVHANIFRHLLKMS